MIIFPAIDLKGGQVVRLAEGDMARATVYGDDPAAQAQSFADQGATHLHVVDLDGAFAGGSVNGSAVESIVAAFPGFVQVGGGVRDMAAVERWFDRGVARVVIGTAALTDPDFVRGSGEGLPQSDRRRRRCSRRDGRDAWLGRGVRRAGGGHGRRGSRMRGSRRCCSPMSGATGC